MRTHIASLTDYSKVAKIAGRHKIVSVHVSAEGCVSQQSSTPEKLKRKVFPLVKCPGGLLAWLWNHWIDYVVIRHFSRSITVSFLCFSTNSVLVLAFLFLVLCEVPIHLFVHVHLQAKNSNGTTMETFSILIFCVVLAHPLPFLPLLCHYVLLMGCQL